MDDSLGRLIWDGETWVLAADNDRAVRTDAGTWVASKLDKAKNNAKKYTGVILIVLAIAVAIWLIIKLKRRGK